jgi:hypothetical protein
VCAVVCSAGLKTVTPRRGDAGRRGAVVAGGEDVAEHREAVVVLVAAVRLLTVGSTMVEVADPAGTARTPTAGEVEEPLMSPTPEDLDAWVEHVAVRLGVPHDVIDVEALVGLAGDVASRVTGPAGPLTTFLLGYALAAGDGDATRLRTVAQDLSGLAASWAERGTP